MEGYASRDDIRPLFFRKAGRELSELLSYTLEVWLFERYSLYKDDGPPFDNRYDTIFADCRKVCISPAFLRAISGVVQY